MRKRTNPGKMSSTKSITHLIKIEQAICDSHLKEKLNEGSIAVAKIKSDPNFFFRYTKKNSICESDIGPIQNSHTQLLVNERLDICSLLLDQFNSVFTSPITNMIVHDPVSFFSCQSLNPDECLTDIEIIIDSIFSSDILKKLVSVRVILGLSKTPTHNSWLMKGLSYVPYY